MIIDVKVPQLSESVAEATLVSWHKQAGEAVARDENLIDIETDKVVLELPAPDGGVLVEIVKGDGDTVVAGEVIARIDTTAQAGAVAAPAAKAGAAKAAPAKATAAATAADAAMPAARKILEEKGIAAARRGRYRQWWAGEQGRRDGRRDPGCATGSRERRGRCRAAGCCSGGERGAGSGSGTGDCAGGDGGAW
jgi:2-oxoglutarate dehydrogenase E2 component (EC 2.3.1.61)